jgi:hypothetical protein
LSRLGLQPEQQLLGDGLDIITAIDESGNHVTIYFNPVWHFVRLLHQVGATE